MSGFLPDYFTIIYIIIPLYTVYIIQQTIGFLLSMYFYGDDIHSGQKFSMPARGLPSALEADACTISSEEIDTAIKVLRAAAASEGLSEQLQPAVTVFNRRQKQRQRQRQRVERATVAALPATSPPSPAPSMLAGADGGTFTSICLAAPHLSRPLYPNPVCFLATWEPRSHQRNLMTISWLTAIDNEGRFFASMNQRRHSATLLMAHPYFSLSVACAGLEALLTRVGGCSGARLDKLEALGVPLCRPGWTALDELHGAAPARDVTHEGTQHGPEVEDSDDADEGSDDEDAMLRRMAGVVSARAARGKIDAASNMPEADANRAGTESTGLCCGGTTSAWPTDGEVTLGATTDEATSRAAVADGFAVASGVAHVCARVTHVRAAHGHYLLTCETISAFVRSDYWSGKTLERQDAALPPILSFVGSQRFGHVVGAAEGQEEARASTVAAEDVP